MNKIIGSLFVAFLISNSMFCQEAKVKVAIVYDLDSVFTLKRFMASDKEFDINLKSQWNDSFTTHLDSSKYVIEWEEIPNELLPIPSLTNGFSKANRRLVPWIEDLRKEKGFDFVIILRKGVLHPSSSYSRLNSSTYGLVLSKNYCFSLNDIIVYRTSDSRIIYRSKLTSNQLKNNLDKNDKILKPFEEIQLEDLSKAFDCVVNLNDRLVKEVIQRISE